ncbi:hypothetical protein MKW98_028846 [Papaver atlanticum]|uniref:Uncharacterized protein n=1 Tax=Papaver atlanticum TaxID=357466 RepID=A0AAD4S4D3_9MAGN|nr:hypothetical protein MKW98_028846 [Papaver atlanticum]
MEDFEAQLDCDSAIITKFIDETIPSMKEVTSTYLEIWSCKHDFKKCDLYLKHWSEIWDFFTACCLRFCDRIHLYILYIY